jgi:hypothetical protein
MRQAKLLYLWALACSAACGGESDSFDTNPDTPAAVPLEDLPERFAEAYCGVLERCSGFVYDFVFPLEDCATLAAAASRQGGFSLIEAAVDDGRIEYHADLAEACFEAIEARACAEANDRDIEACEAALSGTVPEDGDCELDEECEGSLICETKGACPGRCVERYGAGVPCLENDECANGLVCSTATAHCVVPAGEGAACEGGTEPQCDVGSLCSGNDNALQQPGTCRPLDSVVLRGEGAECDPTSAELCEEGLSCVLLGLSAELAGAWECRALAASGAACRLGLPEHCSAGEYCELALAGAARGEDGECRKLPAPGAACAPRPFGFSPACEAYARCENGQCVALRDLGESCASSAVCYSGYCAAGACEPPRACLD